jgi:hypothetical protein
MSDNTEELSLDQALESAWEKMHGGGDAETGTAAATESAATASESDGSKTADTAAVQDQPADGAEKQQAADTEGQERSRDEKGRFVKAPSSWTATAKAKWESLDPDIQAEVDKRESDFHRGIEEYKGKAQQADEWEMAVAPYRATINGLGVTPQQAVSSLFAVEHTFRYGQPEQKIALLGNLVQQYNIDPSPLFKQQQDRPYVDPEVAALKREIGEFRQILQGQARMTQQQKVVAMQSELQKFQDDPANEHFEAVRGDMAVLLRSGAAKDLEEAYDRAVWSNPETRQLLLAKQQEQARQQQAKKVADAKAAAAVNIARRGAVPATPATQKYATLDEAVYAHAREMGYDV